MINESQRMARKNGIGGSDVAAIIGKSKFKTAVDVYFDKIGDEDQKEETQVMEWGNILEPVILNQYQKAVGVQEVLKPGTIVSKPHPFMFANIDGALHDRTIVEVKTSRTSDGWGEPGTHEIPTDYLCQVAHYRIVTDAPRVDIAVLIGGSDFRIYKYEKVQKLEDYLINAEHDFWHNNVLAKVPPNPYDLEDLKRLFPNSESSAIEANEEVKNSIYEYLLCKNSIDKLEELKEKCEILIKKHMGVSDALVDEYGEILATWKTNETKTASTTKLKKLFPEIWEQCASVSSQRRFSIKTKKEK